RLGLARMEAGNLAGAEEALTAAAKSRPSDPRAIYLLGVVARKKGDVVSARERFTRALSLDPAFAPARLALDRLEAGAPAPNP
ncbi:MAG TPA: tetratricopeptide repeat protein, partial [Candidatus Sulfotelmatobacter sp.]|nr:tetratricopeptide repeat protein [Candidatus Sulfotelmatobacter sp.]